MSKISFSVLELTNEARNMYGIRHKDYQRYRQYCARKIHRLRKKTGLIQTEKKRYEKKDLAAELVKDDSSLQILLFDAERAWSYANQLKVESDEEPRRRHRLIARLKKASKLAEDLHRICVQLGDAVDTRTLLEVEAYSVTISGFVVFEVQQWQEALDKFASARTIYENLVKVSKTAKQEALCHSAMDSIDPNIRYCAYNLKLKGGQSLDIGELVEMQRKAAESGAELNLLTAKVESLLAKSRLESADSIKTITWRGKSVGIKNKKLTESLVGVNQLVDILEAACAKNPTEQFLSLEKSVGNFAAVAERLQLYDKVLGAYWEATRIAEVDLKEDAIATAKVKSSKSDENTAQLHFIFGYITFKRLQKTIERNILLITATKSKLATQGDGPMGEQERAIFNKKPKQEDIIRLLDGILQSLRECKELVAVQSDTILQSVISVKTLIFKAERAEFIGKICQAKKKNTEALAIVDRALNHANEAKNELDGLEKSLSQRKTKSGNDEDLKEARELSLQLASLLKSFQLAKLAQHARSLVDGNVGSETVAENQESEEAKVPLGTSLDTFVSSFDVKSPNLVQFPPPIDPIACKPLFFDVANSFIEFPKSNISKRAQDRERKEWKGALGTKQQEEIEKAGSGITGFISGFWGRR